MSKATDVARARYVLAVCGIRRAKPIGMPYMDGDGTLHRVLPSADQVSHPTFRATAFVELAGSAVAAGFAIVGRPGIAIAILCAAMIPYGLAVLLKRARVLRGLHGGDEGALPAGSAAQLLGPAVALVMAGAGLTAGAGTFLAGAAMLATTAQGLLARPADVAARRAGGALLLASVSFAFGIVSLVDTAPAVLGVCVLTSSAAAALGALGLTTNQLVTRSTPGARVAGPARTGSQAAA